MGEDGGQKDPRRSYLLRIATHIFGLNIVEEKLRNTQPLDKFCDTNTSLLVLARNENKSIELLNTMRKDDSKLLKVAFYKSQAVPLTSDNYKTIVNIVTINGASNEVFLKSVQNVFSASLDSVPSGGQKQLVAVVSELERNLLATVDTNGGGEGVLSLPDEIRVWKSRTDQRSIAYAEALQPLQLAVETSDDQSMCCLTAVVEGAEDSCDQLWTAGYPQPRMHALIQCIASFLCDRISSTLPDDRLWTDPTVPDQLRTAITLCEQWQLSVRLFTAQSWPRDGEHPWKGDPCEVAFLEGFRKRLEQVLSLRQLSSQVGLLLNEKSAEHEIEKQIESAMRGVSALNYNPFTEQAWIARMQVTERAIDPIIERTIPLLKSRLHPTKLDNNMLTYDIEKYHNFLARTKIKEKLFTERETLLARVQTSLENTAAAVDDKMNGHFQTGRFLSEVAGKLVWLRQQQGQIQSIRTISKDLLDDLNGYDSLMKKIDAALEHVKAAESEQYDDWCRETIRSIDDTDSIALATRGKIMVFEAGKGTLNVNYSDRLLRLLREVRQLASLGLNIPMKIVHCVSQGEKFYKYGVTLKQIAHFYNTIDQQMLPCQQALMLDEAIAFEKLVVPKKGQEDKLSTVTWDEPKQVEEFIGRLQAAADKLGSHNRRLRNAHSEIVQHVMDLAGLDVLKDVNRWKEILNQIKSKMSAEELAHGASKANMRPWLIHWDRQLYKALELQYQWGIESLHTQIPLIQAQLVFIQQKLQLRPPVEEIRAKYYKEMRKFLGIPDKFKGMQDSDQANKLFSVMIERNASSLPTVYEKAERLLEKLDDVDKQFADWVVLAQVDLEVLIEEHFKSAGDWERHMKLLKQKGKDAEKLPNEIRLECIVVSTSAVKAGIDEQLQRLFDTLTWTLKHSVQSQLNRITTFLNDAISTLSTRPQSLDEIAAANAKHTEFGKTNKEMKETMAVIDEQHTLLRSVAGSAIEQMSSVQQQWDRFLLMLDSHQLMIKEQVELLRGNTDLSVKNLGDEVEKLAARWHQFKPKSDAMQGDREDMLKAIEFIKEKRVEHSDMTERLSRLQRECEQFDLPLPDLPALQTLGDDITEFEANWILYEEFNTELQALSEEEWIVFRSKTYLFDEFLSRWSERVKAGQQTHMSVRLMKDIDMFRDFGGALKFCRGEQLSTDHWLELFRLIQLPRGTTLERLKFGDLISSSAKILENVDAIKQLNARAQGEVAIREAIQELEMWAAQSEFALSDYKHSNGQQMKVIREWKDAINSVKDSQALLQSLKNSPFYAQFSDKTAIWETRLGDLDVFLSQMNEIQRKWIYLEPIFGRGALPSEASRFARVDTEFRAILNDVSREARLVSLCSRPALKRSLEQIVDQLNRCQRALNQFLEEKRSAFPRFYFLGDDDLLEILGQSTNPTVIQSHLKKLFQGIDRVVFSSGNESLVAMVSSAGEHVALGKPVRVVPQVELWLQQLSDEMRSTLRRLTVDAARGGSLDPGRYPSQVLCLAEEVRFTRECEAALDGGKELARLQADMQVTLKGYTDSKVDDALMELKLKALILDLIHNLDVVEQLIHAKASSTSCWQWQKQLRFYVEKDTVVIRQVYSQFEYTFEYQGNTPKLVHTPLTDKCYLTLTQAMSMGLGGNPYGPAGTGKTESVKALAALFGRQVLVFNCDEGIDVHSMQRIFIGIVQCGAWGCFDEFNRLDQTVLSAVSMQVQTIQDSIRSKSGSCQLGGKTVEVNHNSAIFITLNPAGKGYGGRQKMPDNLKQLFRPVVMSVPDNELIAETLLYSEGFKQAKTLARKIVAVFKLSKEMLSSQQHYDWGLRALKVVLRGCGDLRSKQPEGDERDIVVQALLLNTLSKLTFADSKRFSVLIDDIFADVNKEMAEFAALIEPLKQASTEMGIELTEKQQQKVFQLYEQLRQRMGVVVVGPSGSGKSTLWQVLKRALILSSQRLNVVKFNPKAMSRTKLLGHMDMDTREWTDGVLTMAARQVIKDTSVHTWIVCDGDVDPEWVEALNSVLDDNRLLTMPSGERIQFGSNVNFIFETDDLTYASPATVSRMGMIFISEEDLPAGTIVAGWLRAGGDDTHADLPAWIEQHLYRCVDWARTKVDPLLSLTANALVQDALAHLRPSTLLMDFLVNLFRGLSPALPSEAKKELARDVVFQGVSLPDSSNPTNVYFDGRSQSLACYTDDGGMGVKIEQMRATTRPYVLTAQAQYNRDALLSFLSLPDRPPFLVLGPDGCGKEELLKHCLDADPHSQVATVHCSAQSSAQHIVQALLQNCVQVSSASGRALRPKDKAVLVLYLKSVNLPTPDKYGTAEMLAFVHQLITYGGYYDDNLEWMGVENIQVVASMVASNGAGRHSLPPRIYALMRLFSVDYPTEANLNTIYNSYLLPILEPVLNSPARVESVCSQMVRLFEDVQKTFRPADRPHYVFTPRDLTRWTMSLMRHDLTPGDHDRAARAVVFEAERIFRDRLVDDADRQKFDDMVDANMGGRRQGGDSVYVTQSTMVPSDSSALPLVAIPRQDYTAQLHKAVNRYEFEARNFRSALLDELVELCAKVDRSLTIPAGSMLLAGRAGSGRRDAVQLIAHMHNITVYSPKITPGYGKKHFDNELKGAISAAVSTSSHVLFMLEHRQLLQPSFLESINCLLSSGHVPGLFTVQELDGLTAQLREQASVDGFTGPLSGYFAHRTSCLVHVALLLDVDESDFDVRTAANPALYKQCDVVWQSQWSAASLANMPKLLLSKRGLEPTDDILLTFSQLYGQIPANLASPMKFRVFIENYASIYSNKKNTVTTRLNRLKAGVNKLTEAREQVAKLQKKAAKKSKLLAEKQREADDALGAITASMTGATEQKASMEELRAATEKENEKIEVQKAAIEEQLKEVEPMIKAAREAVGSIKSESLSEIRSLRAPPEAVRDILQAVLLFMGILDTSWEAMRKFLAKSGVKDEIINFDAHNISKDVHKKVSQLVKSKEASFDPKNAKRASAAAAPLAAWVLANLQYSQILDKISPLENTKNELMKNLAKAEKQMAKLSKGLTTVDEKVAELKARFESFTKEAMQIKIDLDQEQATIAIAGTLVERLAGEYTRWQQQMAEMQDELGQLERCSILSAAFVTFLGPTSERVRQSTQAVFRQITNSPQFDALSFLSLETERLNWRASGLPSDQLSTENACMLLLTGQTPLVIDPTGRVVVFLHNHFKGSQVLSAAQNDLITQIELGIRFGKTLIVDDVNEIEPTLIPLLRMDLSSQGPRQVLAIGDKALDYNSEFRLFLCSKNEQIVLPAGIKALVAETNFTTTKSGLTSQLLGLAIQLEKPELEERSGELTRDAEKKKMELDSLEQLLLQQLASSSGNLLDNTELLDSLNASKANAETISRSIEESETLKKQLDEQRNAYLPLAEFASSLFFVFSDLHTHNAMYNYNVNTITKLFKKVVTENNDTSSSRLDNLKRQLQLTVFFYISRSLFKADRLMFALRFVHGTSPNMFQKNEWELFSGVLLEGENKESSAVKNIGWLGEDAKAGTAKLQHHLPTLFNTLRLEDQGTWSEFARTVDAETAVPREVDAKITPFQKVLLIQAVRPDRLYSAMHEFVLKTLGIASINPPTFSLGDIFNESTSSEPILLIIASGVDPSQELEELAHKTVGAEKFHSISMGQGQETAAVQTLRKCAETGEWLCLNNIHLMLQAVPLIQKELSLVIRHESFRLWLTSEADDRFPAILLQECFKVTFEPPPGLRNNLLRSYSQFDGARRNVLTCQTVFVLAWLHALLQERRTYIPQAWTKFYEFSSADIRMARAVVEQMSKDRAPEWEFIRGLLQFVIYGGRIENAFDLQVLVSYLQKLFNSRMITGAPGQQVARAVDIVVGESYKDYVAYIEKCVPSEDDPVLFGLPVNIRFSWQLGQSEQTIAYLRKAGAGSAVSAGSERERWTEAAQPLLSLWKRLCQGGDLHSRPIPQAMLTDNPLEEVMSLEFAHAVKIVQSMHSSLTLLSKAVRGTIVADKMTTQVATSLVLHQTPDSWQDEWTGPSDPASYLQAVLYKAKSTQDLLGQAKNDQLLTKPVNLSKLFRPGTLLTALRQMTARSSKVPMDELSLASAWDGSKLSGVCMSVKGLLLQGALFDGCTVKEAVTSSPPTTAAPALTLAWTKGDSPVYSPSSSVLVPLYRDSERAEAVATVRMPCEPGDVDNWNIAALALFLK